MRQRIEMYTKQRPAGRNAFCYETTWCASIVAGLVCSVLALSCNGGNSSSGRSSASQADRPKAKAPVRPIDKRASAKKPVHIPVKTRLVFVDAEGEAIPYKCPVQGTILDTLSVGPVFVYTGGKTVRIEETAYGAIANGKDHYLDLAKLSNSAARKRFQKLRGNIHAVRLAGSPDQYKSLLKSVAGANRDLVVIVGDNTSKAIQLVARVVPKLKYLVVQKAGGLSELKPLILPLKQLRALVLKDGLLKSDSLLDLSRHQGLKQFSCANCELNGRLKLPRGVIALELNGTDLKESTFRAMVDKLDLRYLLPDVGHAGVVLDSVVSSSPNIEYLDISGASQGAKLEHAKYALKRIRCLQADESHLTDEGLLRMAQGTFLRLVDVSVNDITSDGVLGLAKRHPNIEVLNLSKSNVDNRVFGAVSKMKKLRALFIHLTKVKSVTLQHVRQLRGLVDLRLSDGDLADQHISVIVRNNSRLRRLVLDTTKASDASVDAISALRNLTTLAIGGKGISDRSAAVLSKMKKLRELDLRESVITDQGLAKIGALPNLRKLHVANTKVTKRGVLRFKNNHPKCAVSSDWD